MPAPDPTSRTDEHGEPKADDPNSTSGSADAQRDPKATDHPAGADHAAGNAADEPAG